VHHAQHYDANANCNDHRGPPDERLHPYLLPSRSNYYSRQRCKRTGRRNEYGDGPPRKLGSDERQTVVLANPAVLDHHVSTGDVAGFLQPAANRR
jgi:hypothetical protein